MIELLKRAIENREDDGIFQIHNLKRSQTDLKYLELKVIDIKKSYTYAEELEGLELCIVAFQGRILVKCENDLFGNIGTRQSAFEKVPTDSVYISNNKSFYITALDNARVILCYAPSNEEKPTKLIRADEVGVQINGEDRNKSLNHAILTEHDDYASSLMVSEVFTSSGNWADYPPRKNDEDNLPHEAQLEEVYYHEIDPKEGYIIQRVYTDDKKIDETKNVENTDVMIIPRGYHVVGVPEGSDSYFLKVVAGPKRVLKFKIDPKHVD